MQKNSNVKITWDDVYLDFQKRYPTWRKIVRYWHPHTYGTILIHFEDGITTSYNYDDHQMKFIKDPDLN